MPTVPLFNVSKRPDAPVPVSALTVIVVDAGNVIVFAAVDAAYVEVMSLNVFAPETVNAPAPPLFNAQAKVEPPPTNVLAVVPDILIEPTPVPFVVVKPVGAALLKAVVIGVAITMLPPLKVMFLVPAAVKNVESVTAEIVSV